MSKYDKTRIICDEFGNIVSYELPEQIQEAFDKVPLIQETVSIEEQIFKEKMVQYPDFEKKILEAGEKSPLLAKLAKDLFLLLFKSNPEIIVSDKPSYVYLLGFLQKIIDNTDYAAIKKMTTFNGINSALMTLNIIESLLNTITDEQLAALNNLNTKEEELEKIIATYAEDMSKMLDVSSPDELRKQLRERLDKAKELRKELEQKLKEIQQSLENSNFSMEEALTSGISTGNKQISNLIADLAAFGVNPGNLHRVSHPDIIALAEKRKNNPYFQKILDELGRQYKIRKELEESHSKLAPNQGLENIISGDDLTRLSSSELVSMNTPELSEDFDHRFIDGELDIIDDRAQLLDRKGKYLVVKDSSGSMYQSEKNIKTDSTSLSALNKAKDDDRETALVTFGSVGEVKIAEFDNSQFNINSKLESVEFGYGGGTNFESPLDAALSLIETDKYSGADILFITDGECDISDKFLARFLEIKKKKNLRCIGVFINVGASSYGQGAIILEKFCDKVILISDCMDDAELLKTIFTP